ncbi:MAG: helix-turn-helix transcriptional regulator [Pseudonocardiales bacterium]|nr:helix-turn-helix transcriptional regulator [Pseudonocardiales bacterium]MBV9030695.1 helix-turn-helix transcriptional regulator [Pseudonocardiales bacterium]
MSKATRVDRESIEIGRRARLIRRRRGLSLEVAAGLSGMTKSYLSMLERGERPFLRRKLVEDLANGLGCSVTDLTGQSYPPVDRDTADALAAVPGIQAALHNYGPDDVPDVRPRPLDELVAWARSANDHRDQSRLSAAGRDIGTLLTELQVYASTAGSPDRDRAVTALVTACGVAGPVAHVSAGNRDLAAVAGRRVYEVAQRHGDPWLIGFARWFWALSLSSLGAQDRARRVVSTGIDELAPVVRLSSADTLPAEWLGMLHGSSAWILARQGRGDEARAHLDEAGTIADRIGERHSMRRHFGPTNVRLYRLATGVELGEGGRAYAEVTRTPLDVDALGSSERSSKTHLELARALVQDGPDRDADAIRHLDTADRLAPQRIRMNPVARELVTDLSQRARRRVWELDSLCSRFGLGDESSRRAT